jgi:hypothetical protein
VRREIEVLNRLMMKRLAVIVLIITPLLTARAESVYDQFLYENIGQEAVSWFPEAAIYYNSLYVNLNSEYGKIFYLIGDSLHKTEPRVYKESIFLAGEEGQVKDYKIIVMLEKQDGRIELYSRIYRIDRTKQFEKQFYSKEDPYRKQVINKNRDQLVQYTFETNQYAIKKSTRDFTFPLTPKTNSKNQITFNLEGKDGRKTDYLVSLAWKRDNTTYVEIHPYSLDGKGVLPPSFGSLYWGQIYKQSYRLRIKPADPDDLVYYWYREWKSDNFIFGPPELTDRDQWNIYSGPIELTSKWGKDGISGIAAYSVNKSGMRSILNGPYYFKVMDLDTTFEQVFEDEQSVVIKTNQRNILLNGTKITKRTGVIKDRAELEFKNFSSDERYYYTLESQQTTGKSGLLPCEGVWTFTNRGEAPLTINLFFANGTEIGRFVVSNSDFVLPVMKKYPGNYFDLSADTVFDFHMPVYTVRYAATSARGKHLVINEESPEFSGKLKISTDDGTEKMYKVKFASFDKNGKKIGESDYYRFHIDKVDPTEEVTSRGVLFDIYHNETQRLILEHPDADTRIFYRFKPGKAWVHYKGPLLLHPPDFGTYSITVYTRAVDRAGNTYDNREPFTVKFDRRALFVDNTRQFSGNGTESAPYNNIEGAIIEGRKKNIKLINLVNDKITISQPVEIKSDIILQPWKSELRTRVVMSSKSIWRKKLAWFSVVDKGYLEIRNMDFVIRSGNMFASQSGTKMKAYQSGVLYTGSDDFTFIKNRTGKTGLQGLSLFVTGNPGSMSFCDVSYGSLIVRNMEINIIAGDVTLFTGDNTRHLDIQKIRGDITANSSLQFCTLAQSDVLFSKILIDATGDFKTATLFDADNSTLSIDSSDFLVTGSNSFEIYGLNQKRSRTTINTSLFQLSNSSSILGFNSHDSSIEFNRSMLDISDTFDYSYGFREKNSSVMVNSSIVRTINSAYSVAFLLNQGSFEGVNNSVFTADSQGRAYAFWITDRAQLTSVNSLYYFTDQNEKSAFAWMNNETTALFRPEWYSNIVSDGIRMFENLVLTDHDTIIDDFLDKNIFHGFTNEFRIKGRDFFIPLVDSPVLQGGLSEVNSPLPVPEKDFLGNSRSISGIGIDVGAIQRSGHF